MLETAGIIISTRFKIETILKSKKAFDQQSAAYVQDSKAMIDLMEKNGLIERTLEGKVFMTKKGIEQQINGASVSVPAHRIIHFSRNIGNP